MINNSGKIKDYTSNPMELPKELLGENSHEIGTLHKEKTHLMLKVAQFAISFAGIVNHSPLISKVFDSAQEVITHCFHSYHLANSGEHILEACQALNKLKHSLSLKELGKTGSKISKVLEGFQRYIAHYTLNFLSSLISIKTTYQEYKEEKKVELIHPGENRAITKDKLKKKLIYLAKIIFDIALFVITTASLFTQTAAIHITAVALLGVQLLSTLWSHKTDCEIFDKEKHKIYPLTPHSHFLAGSI